MANGLIARMTAAERIRLLEAAQMGKMDAVKRLADNKEEEKAIKKLIDQHQADIDRLLCPTPVLGEDGDE